jgi:hypothetical protein
VELQKASAALGCGSTSSRRRVSTTQNSELGYEVLKEIQELWLDEAEQRDRAVDDGKMELIPAEEVMREAWARLS